MNEFLAALKTTFFSAAETKAGTNCPVCGKYARVYRWSMYPNVIRFLALTYKFGGVTDFVPLGDIKDAGWKGGGDANRLRLFGLAEPSKERRADTGKIGEWKCLPAGLDYLRGIHTVPKYLYQLYGEVYRTEGPQVNVSDGYKNPFDLRKHLDES